MIREATLEDHQGIMAVHGRNGLSQKSYAQWSHHWVNNPFLVPDQHFPIGWVVEDEGQVVGTFGNIPLGYEMDGQRLLAAAATSWAADPPHRSAAGTLMFRFLKQEGVDLLLDTSANYEAGRLLAAAKMPRMPSESYGEVLLWITDHRRLAVGAMQRRGVPGAGLWGYPAGALLWALDHPWQRWRHAPSENVAVVKGFDQRFDRFWDQLRRQPGRLMAVRDRDALDWHFHLAREQGRLTVLTGEEEGSMFGYAVLLRSDFSHLGLRRSIIADVQTIGGSPQHIQSLLLAGVDECRRQGMDLLEVIGLDEPTRAALKDLKPRSRTMSTWPYFYKACRSELQGALEKPDSWFPSPLDGDTTL